LSSLGIKGVDALYIQYFKKPGIADAELELDIEASLRHIAFSGSGEGG